MINAVKDIQYHLKFRKENKQGRSRGYRRMSNQHKQSGYGSDRMQVNQEATLLSRMGLSWGESDVTVDEYGFRFVLVFRKSDGRELTISGSKIHEDDEADLALWLVSDEEFKGKASAMLDSYPDRYPMISDLEIDLMPQIEQEKPELSEATINSIFSVAFVYWKVSLMRSEKEAIRAVSYPFFLYRVSKH